MMCIYDMLATGLFRLATAILVVLILLMTATTVFASTVSYSNVSIGNGEYQHFTSYNYELFDISANTSVTHDITFTDLGVIADT
ncbi:MAG: hypothetical protein DBX55_00665 [Verrucomicrobia bacterium]|nr:MAG: hypothetical protein DBX55_00665 [Verrucomicrobiota bacterium]